MQVAISDHNQAVQPQAGADGCPAGNREARNGPQDLDRLAANLSLLLPGIRPLVFGSMPRQTKPAGHLAGTEEGPFQELLVDPPHQLQIPRRFSHRRVVERGAADPQEHALTDDAEPRMGRLDHPFPPIAAIQFEFRTAQRYDTHLWCLIHVGQDTGCDWRTGMNQRVKTGAYHDEAVQ